MDDLQKNYMKQLSGFEDGIGQVCSHGHKVFIVFKFCEMMKILGFCQMGTFDFPLT